MLDFLAKGLQPSMLILPVLPLQRSFGFMLLSRGLSGAASAWWLVCLGPAWQAGHAARHKAVSAGGMTDTDMQGLVMHITMPGCLHAPPGRDPTICTAAVLEQPPSQLKEARRSQSLAG